MTKLPLKEIVFETGVDGTGVFAMSVVKDPAIKKTYVYFSEHKPLKFAIQSEEKRIIFAPALIPDMEVYREMNGEKFNLTVSRETIENIAVDFLKNNRANQVNLEHKEVSGQPAVIDGVTMFQFLLTDEHTCKSVVGYEDLPVGTWFIGAKVNNDQVWHGVKDGTFTGWSIHAIFDAKPVNLSVLETNDIELVLKEYFTKNS